MAGGRRGLVSSINNFTIEELANKMLVDPQLENKVKLYSNNQNMNDKTREHAKLSYDLFRILRLERWKVRKAETAARVNANIQARREQWVENNPTSLRFKSVPQIVEVLETDKAMRNKVSSYLSNSNSNLSEEYQKRLRLAMIAYYMKTNPNSPVLTKHLNKLIPE